uniref:Immunoglobulin V-set domain-containing protein n=1 Tax=Zonotrichia albicollis TaxID=44394 RepID=A0A8D2M357_ZONAL
MGGSTRAAPWGWICVHCWDPGASDPTEVIGVLGKSVTFHTPNTDANPALWFFGDKPIVTVAFEDPPQPIFYKDKFKTRFAVSERGRALKISQLRMEDAGTYSVTINGKRSNFTLQVFSRFWVSAVRAVLGRL